MKTEVYSWRVSTDIKSGLEHEARRRNISLSRVLDLAAADWLQKNAPDSNEEEQRRIRQEAVKSFGVIASGDPKRSESTRTAVRDRLRRRHGR